ncbi:ABC transporter ATP-binding protein/permease [Aquimarina sp. ERC-38]|uniref:ABC transporter ATP-binding protein n=1 Tax=Aquimarina sp. ERC-38 TaxID=2949996 RepID=UPI002247E8BD|nr:ABC transporter ATP-binding protein [Aquimarina sp. ERC-38]UZO80443.1 ABC transporter ATP-binding protein/permease [Aquimarina sp. ERC-38]
MKELSHLNKYFKKYKLRLLLGVVITVIARLFSLAVPKLVGNSVNEVELYLNGEIASIAEVKSGLLLNIGYLLGAALITALFTFLMRQTFIVVSRNIEFDLKNEVFQHYMELSLNFYKKNRTGDLMNRISEDVSKVRMYVGPAIMYGVNTLTMFVVVIGYMFNSAPLLAMYTILPLPILSVLIYKLSVLIHKRTTIVQQYLSKLTTFTQESFSGIAVIKAYGIEGQTHSGFTSLANESKVKNVNLAQVQALFFPLMILLIGLSNLTVIYIGGNQYINGKIDLGTILEFIIFVNMLTWPVATVGWVSSIIQQAAASQTRINEFLQEEPEILKPVTPPQAITFKGKISFKNVTFTYDDTNITALKNINFTVSPGETLAIIGKTGSGKSTILDLIGRLYDPTKGTILIDSTPLPEVHLTTLREAVGYVPQDAFLFSDSIKNNIRFGQEDASLDEVIVAAKDAVVHKNIEKFQKTYETVLGERGITLSGGQKQRVSIARAIIKNPKILLFDDCLSAVDTETEEQILHNLHKVSKNTTTFLVSHRISTVRNADKIIVLEEGRIIQQGTHNELVNKEGYYHELYEKQLKEKEI